MAVDFAFLDSGTGGIPYMLYLKKKAPLGDPIEITIRGYELTLRKDEASMVEIELGGF